MAYLINRNPAARFECLHALVKFINSKFGTDEFFSLIDIKYEKNEPNIHNYCSLLKKDIIIGKYCPYKQSHPNDSGCSLTNGKKEDTTKSKEVSNTVNALHALGFVSRENDKVKLTNFGLKFAQTKYDTLEMKKIIITAVLKYGPVIGVLYQIFKNKCFEFAPKDIKVGYPVTNEKIIFNDKNVTISSGSEKDSNTRTKSCILAWLTLAGFIRPKKLPVLKKGEFAHIAYRDFINQKQHSVGKYVIVRQPDFFNDNSFITGRPLDYINLTKLTAALREKNSAEEREATMLLEPKIQNRRFAIVYLLNKAFEQGKTLKLHFLIKLFNQYPKLFVVTKHLLEETVRKELEIANMAGIPFKIINSNEMKPLVGVNLKELTLNVPKDVIGLLEKFEVT